MQNIYNFLKNVCKKAKNNLVENPIVFFVFLVLFTIPLPYIYNSISVILLGIYSVYYAIVNKQKPVFTLVYYLFFALFALMLLSYFWTIDEKLTLSAISKSVSIILIPIFFSFFNTQTIQQKILKCFAITGIFYSWFFLLRAVINYCVTQNTEVFFYHGLVPQDVNAIHISVYIATSFFALLIMFKNTWFKNVLLVVEFIVLILLSSKNITVLFLILLALYALTKILKNKNLSLKTIGIGIFSLLIVGIFISQKIFSRFKEETNTDVKTTIVAENGDTLFVNVVSIKDAWNKEQFKKDDYLTGFSLRTYQIRIFFETMKENQAYLTGFGLNATDSKIKQKRIQYNLYEGYDVFNFHNQYLQFFSELGIFGFLLIVLILIINIKNSICRKDFIHFSFAILMISLFLTESFLARQRGIVFFTTMYFIFNGFMYKKTV